MAPLPAAHRDRDRRSQVRQALDVGRRVADRTPQRRHVHAPMSEDPILPREMRNAAVEEVDAWNKVVLEFECNFDECATFKPDPRHALNGIRGIDADAFDRLHHYSELHVLTVCDEAHAVGKGEVLALRKRVRHGSVQPTASDILNLGTSVPVLDLGSRSKRSVQGRLGRCACLDDRSSLAAQRLAFVLLDNLLARSATRQPPALQPDGLLADALYRLGAVAHEQQARAVGKELLDAPEALALESSIADRKRLVDD